MPFSSFSCLFFSWQTTFYSCRNMTLLFLGKVHEYINVRIGDNVRSDQFEYKTYLRRLAFNFENNITGPTQAKREKTNKVMKVYNMCVIDMMYTSDIS